MTADGNDGGGLFGGGGRLGVLSTVGGSSRRLEDFELMKHSFDDRAEQKTAGSDVPFLKMAGDG